MPDKNPISPHQMGALSSPQSSSDSVGGLCEGRVILCLEGQSIVRGFLEGIQASDPSGAVHFCDYVSLR